MIHANLNISQVQQATDGEPMMTLLFVSREHQCWYCEKQPLRKLLSWAIHCEFHGFQLVFAVCSAECADAVVAEVPEGTQIRILRPDELEAFLRDRGRRVTLLVHSWCELEHQLNAKRSDADN